jgi:transposase-like protein
MGLSQIQDQRMRISGRRLKEKTSMGGVFVGGVTARIAADLARVNRYNGI